MTFCALFPKKYWPVLNKIDLDCLLVVGYHLDEYACAYQFEGRIVMYIILFMRQIII